MAVIFHWVFSIKLTQNRFTTESETSKPQVVLMVTCYSENEQSIRGTLESLAASDYPSHKKLLFIVADGMITGSGNTLSTPNIIKSMVHSESTNQESQPKSYLAIAKGTLQYNMATVVNSNH